MTAEGTVGAPTCLQKQRKQVGASTVPSAVISGSNELEDFLCHILVKVSNPKNAKIAYAKRNKCYMLSECHTKNPNKMSKMHT
jgi:hypothetical protein